MPNYYYYRFPDEKGYYEVHSETCPFLPAPQNRVAAGNHNNCHQAIAYLKLVDRRNYDGCYHCCKECHKG